MMSRAKPKSEILQMSLSSSRMFRAARSRCSSWHKLSNKMQLAHLHSYLYFMHWHGQLWGTCPPPSIEACACTHWHKSHWHSAYRWQQYDVIMTSWSNIEEDSKTYHQNFLLCSNNEIATCIADLCNSFCEVYAVAILKVVQQQTIGEVGSSVVFVGR